MIPLNRNLLKLKRSGIRAYSALAAETPGCISLTLGEPEFDTPAPVTAAGKAALDGGKTHYAPNAGLMDLRRAIAKTENREPEEVMHISWTASAWGIRNFRYGLRQSWI